MVRKSGPSIEHMNVMPNAFKEGKLPTKEINLTSTDIERFWKRVNKGDGCWEWTGSTHKGYASLQIKQKKFGAHRVSYTIANGPIPEGFSICHKCDNPKCVRPDHLFAGTSQDNTTDRIAKGRGKIKLNASQAAQIKQLVYTHSTASAGRMFGIDGKQVAEIWDWLYWKHVPGPKELNWRTFGFHRPSSSRRKVSPETRERIRSLYATGEYSLTKLGKMIGVNHATIRSHVKGVVITKMKVVNPLV